MPPRVKICGITNAQDAQAAIASGASYLGLIFAESSPRRLSINDAQEIAQGVNGVCPLVGVFQNALLSEVERIADAVPLDFLQFHGDESSQYCAHFDLPVVKVFSVNFTSRIDPLPLVNKYVECCDFVMFDRPKSLVDPHWLERAVGSLKKYERDLPSYFLAGGLSATNLQLVLDQLHPHAVDVARGVEMEVGRKDVQAMRDFCDVANAGRWRG
jgi:phosphoribosylanthranilate isomerase